MQSFYCVMKKECSLEDEEKNQKNRKGENIQFRGVLHGALRC